MESHDVNDVHVETPDVAVAVVTEVENAQSQSVEESEPVNEVEREEEVASSDVTDVDTQQIEQAVEELVSAVLDNDEHEEEPVARSQNAHVEEEEVIEEIERIEVNAPRARAMYGNPLYDEEDESATDAQVRQLIESLTNEHHYSLARESGATPQEIMLSLMQSGASPEEVMQLMASASSNGNAGVPSRFLGPQDEDEEEEDKSDEDLSFVQWLRSSLPTVNNRKLRLWAKYGMVKCMRLGWTLVSAGALTCVPFVLLTISESNFLETAKMANELEGYKRGQPVVGTAPAGPQVDGYLPPSSDLLSGIPSQ